MKNGTRKFLQDLQTYISSAKKSLERLFFFKEICMIAEIRASYVLVQ